jgi:Undecaprenyl-phosphate glucose phosphotransferase
MITQRARLTNLLLSGLDSIVLLSSFLLVIMARFREAPQPVLFFGVVLLFPLCLITLSFFGLYNSRRTASCFSDFFIILKSMILTALLIAILNFLLAGSGINMLFLIRFLTVAFLTLAAYRSVLRLILRRFRERGINTKKVVLVGLNPLVGEIFDMITSHLFYGYKVIGVFGPESSTPTRFPLRGNVDDFVDQLSRYSPDEAIISLPFEFSSQLPDLIIACELHGVQARVSEPLATSLGIRGHVDDIGGIRLVSAHTYPTERLEYVVFKRLFDFIASFSLLVLLAPLLLLIALGVKYSSKGPIFFRQQRVGLSGKRFWIMKFRTMTHVEDIISDTEWMPQDMNRFTRFGIFLRRTNLDELPQLLNVFMGQMSLVGPRPERPFYAEMFKKEVPQYMLRHYIQCGMTGWAQINGWRGNTSIHRRVEHDLYYLKNWGFWFDIKILFFTLFRGFYQRRAYW